MVRKAPRKRALLNVTKVSFLYNWLRFMLSHEDLQLVTPANTLTSTRIVPIQLEQANKI